MHNLITFDLKSDKVTISYVLHTRHCVKCFTYITLFNPHNNPSEQVLAVSHFKDILKANTVEKGVAEALLDLKVAP